MARDDSAKAKKQRWADWVNAGLAERDWNAADLVEASGGTLVYNTVYNWSKATARAEAEAAIVVAVAFKVSPSEALNAASYPILADALEGKELRLVGAPATEPIDPGILEILATKELPESTKAVMIKWWRRRLAEDEARRRADAEQMLELKKQDSA